MVLVEYSIAREGTDWTRISSRRRSRLVSFKSENETMVSAEGGTPTMEFAVTEMKASYVMVMKGRDFFSDLCSVVEH